MPSLRQALRKHIDRIKWNINNFWNNKLANPYSPQDKKAMYDFVPSIWNLFVQYLEVKAIGERFEQILVKIGEQKLSLIGVLVIAVVCIALL